MTYKYYNGRADVNINLNVKILQRMQLFRDYSVILIKVPLFLTYIYVNIQTTAKMRRLIKHSSLFILSIISYGTYGNYIATNSKIDNTFKLKYYVKCMKMWACFGKNCSMRKFECVLSNIELFVCYSRV